MICYIVSDNDATLDSIIKILYLKKMISDYSESYSRSGQRIKQIRIKTDFKNVQEIISSKFKRIARIFKQAM